MGSAPLIPWESRDRLGAEGKGQSSGTPAFLCLSECNFHVLSAQVQLWLCLLPCFGRVKSCGVTGMLCAGEGRSAVKARGGAAWGPGLTRKWWSPWAQGTQMRLPVLCLVWLLCECMSAGSSSCSVPPTVSISNHGGLPLGGADRIDAKGSPYLSCYSWAPKPLG